MKRIFTMAIVALVVFFGFTGCEAFLDAFGLGSKAEIDLTVTISFTNTDSVIINISNAGSETASAVPFNVYLTTGTDVQPNDDVVKSDFLDIPPTSTEKVEIEFADFEVPETVENDSYRVGVIVDPNNTITESSDNNNKATSDDLYDYTGGTPLVVEDLFEDNDTALTATWMGSLDVGFYYYFDIPTYGLAMLESDETDFYEILIPAAGYFWIETIFDGENTDLDLYLYDSVGTLVASSNEINTAVLDYERIQDYYATAGTYFIEIFHYSGSDSYYDLWVELYASP